MKTKKSKEQHLKILEVQERALEKLDELFDMLWEEAQGVPYLVTPHANRSEKPKRSKKIADVEGVEKICKSCKQPILKEPREVWEVWLERRDSQLIKFLYEQLAGKAAAKASEQVDPEIIVVFPDIMCDGKTELKAVAVPKLEEEKEKDKPKFGLQ